MEMKNNEPISISGRYRFKTYRAGTRELLRTTPWIRNAVTAASGHGLNIITRRLCGDLTYDIMITKAKIGTGTTAPTTADTNLETVVTDNIPLANQGASGAVATLEFFITDSQLPDGTYEEFGIFAGNQLFARSLISPSYTKAANEDTAAEYVITFANA